MTTSTPFAALAVACLVGLACGGKPTESTPTPSPAKVDEVAAEAPKAQVGQTASDFEVRDEAGNAVRLADHRGKQAVLLAFYPKDFTAG